MANNNKMKGLLKGLRYISQIFDQDEKEAEMEIGYPTDVKHVAHIGWDGPSVSNPSWMNEFKGPTGSSSAPLSTNMVTKEDPSVKWVSEEQGRRSTGSATTDSPKMASSANSGRDPPELPKSSRRHSSTSASASSESPTKTKSDKQKQTRRSPRGATKDQADGAHKPTRHHHKDPSHEGTESPSNLPDIPKKTRRKKSKDAGGSTSKTSRSRAQASEVDGGSVTNRDHSHSSCAEETELT